jgi:hypothetical protein
MPEANEQRPDAASAAAELASRLEQREQEYALGGAIALGYWGEQRGTVDVDLTLFLPSDQPTACVRLLHEIGCEVASAQAIESLQEQGFCQTRFAGVRVDVFVPNISFYEAARRRRRRVPLRDRSVLVWDAETLCVFKMMFFRRKDLADVEQVLRIQGAGFDRQWVRTRLEDIFGRRDPRLSRWNELCAEVAG